jgi:hypothetical protein
MYHQESYCAVRAIFLRSKTGAIPSIGDHRDKSVQILFRQFLFHSVSFSFKTCLDATEVVHDFLVSPRCNMWFGISCSLWLNHNQETSDMERILPYAHRQHSPQPNSPYRHIRTFSFIRKRRSRQSPAVFRVELHAGDRCWENVSVRICMLDMRFQLTSSEVVFDLVGLIENDPVPRDFE